MFEVNKIIPVSYHVTCTINTEGTSKQLAGLLPSPYGMLEIVKGYNDGFCTFIFYESTARKTWMYTSRGVNGVEVLGGDWRSIATESYVDSKCASSSKSVYNGLNYESNLTRTYQLEWNKAYLVTSYAVSFNNAGIANNSGVFFVFTGISAGTNSVVKEIWQTGELILSVNNNCVLSITGDYMYLHYSITRL